MKRPRRFVLECEREVRAGAGAARRFVFFAVGAFACPCGLGLVNSPVLSLRAGVAGVRCPCGKRHEISVGRGFRHRSPLDGMWLMTYAPRSESSPGEQVPLPGVDAVSSDDGSSV